MPADRVCRDCGTDRFCLECSWVDACPAPAEHVEVARLRAKAEALDALLNVIGPLTCCKGVSCMAVKNHATLDAARKVAGRAP